MTEQDEPVMHTCSVCNYAWAHGTSGAHDCTVGLKLKIAEDDELLRECHGVLSAAQFWLTPQTTEGKRVQNNVRKMVRTIERATAMDHDDRTHMHEPWDDGAKKTFEFSESELDEIFAFIERGPLGCKGIHTWPNRDDKNQDRIFAACIELEKRGKVVRLIDEPDHVFFDVPKHSDA